MAIDKIFNDSNVDGIADNIFGAVNNSVSEVKQMQQRKAAENVQMVVEAFKKIETNITEKFDNVTDVIEKRVLTIKDGRDGSNGSDGRNGRDGKPGRDGVNGKQGIPGTPGKDGVDGVDGVSVTDASIDFDGSLVISLSSGQQINVGEVVPPELERQLVELRQGGGSAGSSGDVAGPTASTDNAIVRFDGTTGKLVQNSVVTIGDTGNMAGVGTLGAGAITATSLVSSGTAASSFTVTSGTAVPLTITNVGTGNSFVVEDLASPDASPFVIDSAGRVIVGNTAATTTLSGVTPAIQLSGTGIDSSAIGSFNYSAGVNGPFITTAKSRGGAIGTETIVQSGDNLLTLRAYGSDGVAPIQAAQIRVEVDGTPGVNDMPGRLTFSTTADGASSPTERMRISSTGQTTISGNTIISVTDNTNAALRITQLGTGNALLVEDSTNPDSTPVVIDNAGNLTVGAGTQMAGFGSLQALGTGNFLSAIGQFSADTGGAIFSFNKSRSTTIGSPATGVASGDQLGQLRFYGADGTTFIRAAAITGEVDGTPGTSDMPGRLVFSTTADGASTPTERVRIDSAGNVGIGAVPTSAAKSNITSTSAGASTIALSLQNASNTVSSETVLDFVTNTAGAGVRAAQITAINTDGSTGLNMVFKISNGAVPAEAMRITSLGGLKIQTGVAVGAATPGTSGVAFPATAVAVADANTLDDYEEGSWTPVVTFTGGNGDLTTAEALGVYTKIGRLVQIAFNVEFSETTALTNLTITGVPFTSGASTRTNVGCWVDNMTALVGSPIAGLGVSATTISVQTTGTGVAANITNANTGTSSRVRGSLSYSI